MSLPNQITLLRFLFTPAFAYSFFQPGLTWKLLALILYSIGAITDKLDGYLARKYKSVTALGKFLDPLADKVLVTTGFVCLVFTGYAQIWMVVVIVLRDLMITLLRSYSYRINQPIHTLFIAQCKTVLQMSAIFLALLYIVALQASKDHNRHWSVMQFITERQLVLVMMTFVTLFTAFTGIIYLIVNRYLLIRIRSTAL